MPLFNCASCLHCYQEDDTGPCDICEINYVMDRGTMWTSKDPKPKKPLNEHNNPNP